MSNPQIRRMAFVILSATFLFLSSCTSALKNSSEETAPQSPSANASVIPPLSEEPTISIDVFGLQRGLGLERTAESLGFSERKFNTCEAGYGFSRSLNCQNKYFVVIHFQLLCRDSIGTISTALQASDMRPISQRSVNWSIRPAAGNIETDSDGYGQIRMIASGSQRGERLKLTVGNDFLYMSATEITKVVTPQPWCNP